jgi:ADP-ribose pyrophosphatase YjhB (NUDIX family)
MEYREDADVRLDNIQSRGIVLKDDLVLVMWRKKHSNEYYVFPGGHMRKGETPEENAIREIFEETTIKVKEMELAYEFKDYAKPEEVSIDYLFVGRWVSGEPELSGEESRRADEDNQYKPMWVEVGEVSNLLLYPLVSKEWFEDRLEKFLRRRV